MRLRTSSALTRPRAAGSPPRPRGRWWSSAAAKASDPLRILFCGSDEFSCASLAALHAEHRRNPGLVRSIDVFARPDKPFGRGRKELREGSLRPPPR